MIWIKKIIIAIIISATLITSCAVGVILVINETKEKIIWSNITKTIVAHPQGDVGNHCNDEQRRCKLSIFQPTGIFVGKKSKITVTLNRLLLEPFSIYIGQWSSYKNLNYGQKINPIEYKITNVSHIVTSELEGMLYVANKSEINNYQVTISVNKGIKVPTFKINETSQKEFINQLYKYKSAPFFEIIGQYCFGTFQMDLARKLWLNSKNTKNINDIVMHWDQYYELENKTHGLSINSDGVAHKFPNKIHFTNPDSGPGYASATDYRIIFQQDTKAGEHLFTADINDQWGLWHEMGHTYQNQNYTWNELDEVTVNIYSLWIQRELGFNCRLITDNFDSQIKNFVQNTDPQKSFDKQNEWVKLGLFWQLDQAFGKWFYPTLNQEYRLLRSEDLPKNDDEKKQLFIRMTSKITNRNLISFFSKWGILADNQTQNIVSQYQHLTNNIWNNIFDDNYGKKVIVETLLPKYNPVNEIKFKKNIEINVADTINNKQAKDFILDPCPNTKIRYFEKPKYNGLDLDIRQKYEAYAIIDQNSKIGNKYKFNLKFNFKNTIKINGLGGYDEGEYKAIVGLNKNEKKFYISNNSNELHWYFPNQKYVGIKIFDNNDNEVYNREVSGDENASKFIDLNNVYYNDNFKIEFWFAEPSRELYWDNKINNWVKAEKVISANKVLKFKVENNNLVLI